MPKAIVCTPHDARINKHRKDYLTAVHHSMDYPFQSEDGRDASPMHQQLEATCKRFNPIKYWQFTNCCTDSLQIAFHILCKPGDTVIVPAYGLRAITNAPQFVGLHVIYCDIDDTGNIDLNQLQHLIIEHKPTAVLIVHNFGTIVDISKITDICVLNNVSIIEDAAPSFVMNESYKYKLGSYSDIVCFSFDLKSPPRAAPMPIPAVNAAIVYFYLIQNIVLPQLLLMLQALAYQYRRRGGRNPQWNRYLVM